MKDTIKAVRKGLGLYIEPWVKIDKRSESLVWAPSQWITNCSGDKIGLVIKERINKGHNCIYYTVLLICVPEDSPKMREEVMDFFQNRFHYVYFPAVGRYLTESEFEDYSLAV